MSGELRGVPRRRPTSVPKSHPTVVALLLLLAAVSVGCSGRVAFHEASVVAGQADASVPVMSEAGSAEQVVARTEAGGARTLAAAATAGGSVRGPVQRAATLGVVASLGADRSEAAAFSPGETATVEELLAEGMHRAGASPVHLAIRGTPAADSVRCAWRGIARTTDQREAAIRFWLQLDGSDAIPDVAYLATLVAVVLDTLDPDYRETVKANFLAIARGGESMDYLFLTCFADYAVSHFLLGSGTTPTTVTVAYDPMGDAASYDLYVREHDTGTYGSDALQTQGAYETGPGGPGGCCGGGA